jgi:ABC-2 type transport system ATP-binding protein
MTRIHDETVIDAQGLTKVYGAQMVVDGVSFTVRQGEVFAMIGPNGSGKSTTIRMLCGILKPTNGSARVLDFDIATGSEHIKQHIGYMSQRFLLYEDLTVQRNIEFYAGIYGVPRQIRGTRIEQLMAMAGLTGR